MINETLQWIALAGLPAIGVWIGYRQAKHNAAVRFSLKGLWNRSETDHGSIKNLNHQFTRFTSPEAISEEMEQVASVIEMRQAGRQALPRPGSNPPARVHRPEKRYPGNRGGGWAGK